MRMKLIIKIVGVLLILAGISLLINSDGIYGWVEGNVKNTSLYIAAIVGRLVLGVLLVVAAKESKYPVVIKFFGYLAIIASIVFVLIGHQDFQNFIASMMASFKAFSPVSGLLSMLIGGLLIYAFWGNKESNA